MFRQKKRKKRMVFDYISRRESKMVLNGIE